MPGSELSSEKAAFDKWYYFFANAGLSSSVSTSYAKAFVAERIKFSMLGELDRATLVQLGVNALGDQIAVTRHIRLTLEKQAGVAKSDRQKNTSNTSDIRGKSSVSVRDVLSVSAQRMSKTNWPKKSGTRARVMETPEVSSTTDDFYERFGIRGLVSDTFRKPAKQTKHLQDSGSFSELPHRRSLFESALVEAVAGSSSRERVASVRMSSNIRGRLSFPRKKKNFVVRKGFIEKPSTSFKAERAFRFQGPSSSRGRVSVFDRLS